MILVSPFFAQFNVSERTTSSRIPHDPTNANIVNPAEVLVVMDMRVEDSLKLGEKYCQLHNIPLSNQIKLSIPLDVMVDGEQVTVIRNQEVIYDNVTTNLSDHSWRYFKKYIMEPIHQHLNTNSIDGILLRDTIKYIVMFKGVPFKIAPNYEYSYSSSIKRTGVSVDALLAISIQDDIPNFDILSLFNTNFYAYLENPYYNIEINYEGDYRFRQRYFKNYDNYRLSFLVSRIDGVDSAAVATLIDRSANPDRSGNNAFVIDYHDSLNYLGKQHARDNAFQAKNRLLSLDYNLIYDSSQTKLYKINQKVIGYMSSGKHAGMPPNTPYLMRDSGTVFAPGAVVATVESYNAFLADSIGINKSRQDSMALVSEYLDAGFTGGAGTCYEPWTSTLICDSIFFPAYSAGYNLVEAAYMSMPYLGFRNVVYGDPFVSISMGKQTITEPTVLKDTLLFMGEVLVPLGKTLTISPNSHLKFRKYGFVKNYGNLKIGENVTFSTTNWQNSLLLDNTGNSPKLVWADHPTFADGVGFKVFRKKGLGTWDLVQTILTGLGQHFTDTTINIFEVNKVAFDIRYKVAKYNQNGQSDFSNEAKVFNIEYDTTSSERVFLYQNFPNPFSNNTVFRYKLLDSSMVTLKIYDILGCVVKTLVNEQKQPGIYDLYFNPIGFASGIYFYEIKTDNARIVKKMVFIQ
jgi:uncharacterized protein (TIGR03790 family)